MLDQREITVGGKQYVIQTLPSSRGMQVAIQLAQIAAGAADGIGPTVDKFEDTEINVGKIVSGITRRLDGEATPAMVKRLVLDSVVSPPLSQDSYELQFSGAYDDLWELVAKIIEHNKFVDVLKKRLQPSIAQLFSEKPDPESTRSTKGLS